VNSDADPHDDHGHGSCRRNVAANGTPTESHRFTARHTVLDQWGYGYTSNIIAALEQVVTDGAKVANLVWAVQAPDDPTSQAVDNATAAGMLSVIAAETADPPLHGGLPASREWR
jgi:hypothetical protein